MHVCSIAVRRSRESATTFQYFGHTFAVRTRCIAFARGEDDHQEQINARLAIPYHLYGLSGQLRMDDARHCAEKYIHVLPECGGGAD